jgi:protein-disulfide isomerase
MMSISVLTMLALVVTATPAALPESELTPEQCLGGGPGDPIRIEVFSDFECPACRNFFLDSIRPVLKDYCSQGKVCVVYFEFPLPGHKYSRQASQYVKAAQKLGRQQYFTVMEAIYANQEKWYRDGSLDDTVLKALGPDCYFRLRRQMLYPSIEEEIKNEIALGQKREVTATPTLFVYGMGKKQKVVGPLSYSVLKDFFDRIVK